MAVARLSWPDRSVRVGSSDLVRSILAFASTLPTIWSWPGVVAACKTAVRWLSIHTGVPAVVVAAIFVAVGYRVLRWSGRFAVEVAAVTLALVAASELGWVRW